MFPQQYSERHTHLDHHARQLKRTHHVNESTGNAKTNRTDRRRNNHHSTETARAEPIWDGQLIEMTPA